jgi:hypothetical protein
MKQIRLILIVVLSMIVLASGCAKASYDRIILRGTIPVGVLRME